jgi:hypothetical protein
MFCSCEKEVEEEEEKVEEVEVTVTDAGCDVRRQVKTRQGPSVS